MKSKKKSTSTTTSPATGRRRSTSLRMNLFLVFSIAVIGIAGCAGMMSSATKNMSDDLAEAILNNDDLATVETGGAAYLLMIDGLVEGHPKDEALLRAAATLYSTYTMVFVADEARARRLTNKAMEYAFRAMCACREAACGLEKSSYDEFSQVINGTHVKDVPTLYTLGSAWAAWIQARKDDWNAAAQIARVEAVMKRVVELDEAYQDGGAYLYLGVLATLVPPTLGGKPEVGRKYFEKAINLSGGRNLMAKVLFARHYARLVFDRKLHDYLLNQVLKAEVKVPRYTLINTLAKKQAKELLDGADKYF